MIRFAIIAVAGLVSLESLGADGPKDKKAELKAAIEKANVVVIGKVAKTGLVAASSFDVAELTVTKVLLGDEKIKTAQFRYSGRMTPPYAKVGIEGIWVLSEASKPGWRSVLNFQPLSEEEAVKTIIKEVQQSK